MYVVVPRYHMTMKMMIKATTNITTPTIQPMITYFVLIPLLVVLGGQLFGGMVEATKAVLLVTAEEAMLFLAPILEALVIIFSRVIVVAVLVEFVFVVFLATSPGVQVGRQAPVCSTLNEYLSRQLNTSNKHGL